MPLIRLSPNNDDKGLSDTQKVFAHRTLVPPLEVDESELLCMRWNRTGCHLAAGFSSGVVKVFNFGEQKLMLFETCRGHLKNVTDLRWHPFHPNIVATCSLDKTIRVLDTRAQKWVALLRTEGENACINWTPDGTILGVGGKDNFASFFDARNWATLPRQHICDELTSISWNKRAVVLLCTNGVGEVIIYKWPKMVKASTMLGHCGAINCVDFDHSGRTFATAGADGVVGIWDANHIICTKTLCWFKDQIDGVSFSHDGKVIASYTDTMKIDVTHVESGKRIP
ncbi:WD domain, G-beta repeat protein [Trichuris suis]|nr:WD domain, G-beta repeat protein [Trichuris suis]